MKMTKKEIGKRKVEVHKMEGLYPYVRLEDFMKVCKGLEQENKKLSEENGQLKSDLAFKNTMLDNVSAEYDSSQDVIKKLKEDNRFLTKISKEYMKKENIIEVAEFTELYKDELEEENRKLKERVEELEQCNLNLQTWIDNKEKVNKSLREENKRLSDFLECES